MTEYKAGNFFALYVFYIYMERDREIYIDIDIQINEINEIDRYLDRLTI